jgi:hypothetical protein
LFDAIVQSEPSSLSSPDRTSGNLVEGARVQWEFDHANAVVDLHVIEISRPHTIRFEWNAAQAGFKPVAFSLTTSNGATRVEVTEGGYALTAEDAATAVQPTGGWADSSPTSRLACSSTSNCVPVASIEFSRQESEHDRVAAPPFERHVRAKHPFAGEAAPLSDPLRVQVVGTTGQSHRPSRRVPEAQRAITVGLRASLLRLRLAVGTSRPPRRLGRRQR